jgi:hypothetical protein
VIAQAAILIALSASVAAFSAGVYYQGKKAGKNEIRAEVATQQQIADAAAAKVAHQAAEAISKIKVQNRTVYSEVQREITERPVYRDCQHSPEQLQRLNAALTGASAPEPAGRGLVPRTDAPLRPDLRGDDGQAGGGGRAVP